MIEPDYFREPAAADIGDRIKIGRRKWTGSADADDAAMFAKVFKAGGAVTAT